jgi:hypothetical protein
MMARFETECDCFLHDPFSGREEIEGQFIGFSRGNAEMQCGAGIARLEMLAIVEGVEFGHDLLPVPGVSQMANK